MLFNSFVFALFLPIVFLLYWYVFQRNLRAQNLFIVGVSYLFYGWWDWRFLSLIVFSSLVDFLLARRMAQTEAPGPRRRLLGISLLVNLGLLGVFKYYNFFADQLVTLAAQVGWGIHPRTIQVLLPVGISFYTFQTLSYTIDVYRRRLEPVRDWTVFFAYVSFFPQLVAGPIERATNLIPQFLRRRQFNYESAKDGMRQILWGLFKKIVIADSCASIVDRTFVNYETLGAPALALGAVLFAFQIYCDFSGYSDIAIGTARLFGIKLMQNFSFPYFSRDIAEFWRRWHISLSTWFRDYLYIPLGGSRVDSRWTLMRNVLIIFLVSGFWHGANWTFIAWGALHAGFFMPSILLQRNRRHLEVVAKASVLPSFREGLEMLLTFALVCIAWVFFRAENLTQALDYLQRMATSVSFDKRYFTDALGVSLGIAFMLGMEWLHRREQHGLALDEERMPPWLRRCLYLLLALMILVFTPKTASTFIYFQF
ncbi:MAG: MBOAT family O-acyltransferase [Bacteroidota bacterium]